MTESDIDLLLEAMWNGTKNLMFTSKMGHMPRFLLRVIYKEENYHIGELDKRVRFVSSEENEEIRGVTDGILDITELTNVLDSSKDKIQKICYKIDDRLRLSKNGSEISIKELFTSFKDLNCELLSF